VSPSYVLIVLLAFRVHSVFQAQQNHEQKINQVHPKSLDTPLQQRTQWVEGITLKFLIAAKLIHSFSAEESQNVIHRAEIPKQPIPAFFFLLRYPENAFFLLLSDPNNTYTSVQQTTAYGVTQTIKTRSDQSVNHAVR